MPVRLALPCFHKLRRPKGLSVVIRRLILHLSLVCRNSWINTHWIREISLNIPKSLILSFDSIVSRHAYHRNQEKSSLLGPKAGMSSRWKRQLRKYLCESTITRFLTIKALTSDSGAIATWFPFPKIDGRGHGKTFPAIGWSQEPTLLHGLQVQRYLPLDWASANQWGSSLGLHLWYQSLQLWPAGWARMIILALQLSLERELGLPTFL